MRSSFLLSSALASCLLASCVGADEASSPGGDKADDAQPGHVIVAMAESANLADWSSTERTRALEDAAADIMASAVGESQVQVADANALADYNLFAGAHRAADAMAEAEDAWGTVWVEVILASEERVLVKPHISIVRQLGLSLDIATNVGEAQVFVAYRRNRLSMPSVDLVDSETLQPSLSVVSGYYLFSQGEYSQADSVLVAGMAGVEDRIVSASGSQLLAMSRLGLGDYEGAREAADTVIELTPFDSGGYNIRAAISVAAAEEVGADAVADMAMSMELDSRNADSQALLADLIALAEGESLSALEAL